MMNAECGSRRGFPAFIRQPFDSAQDLRYSAFWSLVGSRLCRRMFGFLRSRARQPQALSHVER